MVNVLCFNSYTYILYILSVLFFISIKIIISQTFEYFITSGDFFTKIQINQKD